jgi:hypothetical protein
MPSAHAVKFKLTALGNDTILWENDFRDIIADFHAFTRASQFGMEGHFSEGICTCIFSCLTVVLIEYHACPCGGKQAGCGRKEGGEGDVWVENYFSVVSPFL